MPYVEESSNDDHVWEPTSYFKKKPDTKLLRKRRHDKDEDGKKLIVSENYLAKGEVDIEGGIFYFKSKIVGDKPEKGYMVFIALHDDEGGSRDSIKQRNDEAWKQLFEAYTPPEGSLWIVPRAPVDHVPLWCNNLSKVLIKKIIKDLLFYGQIYCNQIYFCGVGLGATGVCALAPGMAPQFAAVACISPYGTFSLISAYNLPFYIYTSSESKGAVGSSKCFYKKQIEHLKNSDCEDYPLTLIEKNYLPNLMPIKEENFFETLRKHVRPSIPLLVVWYIEEAEFCLAYFYWLALLEEDFKNNVLVIGLCIGPNKFRIISYDVKSVIVMFNEKMIDFEKEVSIQFNDEEPWVGKLAEDKTFEEKTLQRSQDRHQRFTASKVISRGKGIAVADKTKPDESETEFRNGAIRLKKRTY